MTYVEFNSISFLLHFFFTPFLLLIPSFFVFLSSCSTLLYGSSDQTTDKMIESMECKQSPIDPDRFGYILNRCLSMLVYARRRANSRRCYTCGKSCVKNHVVLRHATYMISVYCELSCHQLLTQRLLPSTKIYLPAVCAKGTFKCTLPIIICHVQNKFTS